MTLKKRLSAATGLLLVACVATPSSAFMADGNNSAAVTHLDAAGILSELRAEVAAGETQCTDLLNKFNQAIAVIDTQLDGGVADELTYLAARESILQMRSDLPCLGEQLAVLQGENGIDGPMDPIGDGQGQVVSDGITTNQSTGSTGFNAGTSGGSSSGAGGLSGGGGGFGLLAAGGIAAAIAIPIATSNNPGTVVSASSSN